MRVLIVALLAAISYAQTERRSLAERRSAVRRRLVEHKGIDSDAAAKMSGADGETTVDLVIVHDDLEVGDNARERCHELSVEFCESVGAHDDVHAINCEPHEIANDFTYVGPDVIEEDSTYYCGQYVYDVHPDELDTLEAILDKIDGSDAKLKISQNHHDYSLQQTSTTCTDDNSDLWHLKAMNPSGMNNFRSNQGFDGEGTIAYIIDTGVNKDHVDFEGRVVGGWNIVDNNDDFSDIDGHGTHVAGSVAGRTTGVAPNALIWGVQVFYFPSPGQGPYTGDSYVGQALEKIVEKVTANGEKAVVNMSLGGRGQNTAYQQIVDAAIAAGVNIVVAAGNNYEDACNFSPAFVPSAVTVGAYGLNGNHYEWAPFSNYGSCVDISAPGVAITGPQYDNVNGFVEMQGTSMAAPHVAGVIATIMSRTGVSDPERVKWMLLGGEYSADLSNLVQAIPSGTTPLFAMQPCIEKGEGEIPTGPPEGVPVVTTTTAAPVVTDFFTMAGGSDCTVNGNCVTSANWPSPHGDNEGCSITVDVDSSVAVNSNFEIERNYDYLRINNDAKWTAEEIPSSLSAGSTISWSTDGSVTKTGWELCFGESDGSNPVTSPPVNTNTPLPTDNTNTPLPTDNTDTVEPTDMGTSDVPTMWPTMGNTDGAVFSVLGSGCTVSGACVNSQNYPSHYGNQQSCTITMTQNVRLSVQSPFEIERSYDYFRVNGAAKWTAGEIPSTLGSGSTITWSTDTSVTKDGWKICFSADDGSDNGDNGGDNSGPRSCDDVSSSVNSNDWQPWCMVSSGPLSAGTLISFSMNWRDQGWGYQKGRVALVEDINEEDPLRHFQTDYAPHSTSAYSGSVTLAQDVDNLEFRFRVGGGGGHRITISDFSYTVTEPDNGGVFDFQAMTEAESLKMKKAKALKLRRMKQHQLEEQIRLDAEIAAREYSMVQEVIGNPLLIEVFAFIGAMSIVGAVVQKGLQYRNKGDYINIEQEI